MRIAFISDVHANLEALEAALGRIRELDVDRVVCLGDLVGYNADPDACVARLRAQGVTCIAGNHDQAAAGLFEPVQFGQRGRRVILWTRRHASHETLAYLKELPVFVRLTDESCAVHAALHPEPNTRYHLTRPERVAASFERLCVDPEGARICFFGHTHRPVVWERDSAGMRQRLGAPEGTVELRPDAWYLINPGTIGQPRENDQRAAFAVWDQARALVHFERVEYDWRSAERKAEAAGLLAEPPLLERSMMYLTNQLDTGRELLGRVVRRGRAALSG